MSAQSIQTHADKPTLSEKARRLLAAHDREVAQFRRERGVEPGGYQLRTAG